MFLTVMLGKICEPLWLGLTCLKYCASTKFVDVVILMFTGCLVSCNIYQNKNSYIDLHHYCITYLRRDELVQEKILINSFSQYNKFILFIMNNTT